MTPEKLQFLEMIGPSLGIGIGLAVVAISAGWVITTWLRIKNGYPLESSWGKPIYPQTDQESVERIKLLSQENAQLRAELGSIKDRLGNVEKIVVDDSHRLSAEIDALKSPIN